MVVKELMNSMYGKTILKPIETETIVKQEKIIINISVSIIPTYNQVYRLEIDTT